MKKHPAANLRLARILLRHAARTAPAARADWSLAMINEMDFLPPQASRIAWALNCVIVSYRMRIHAMNRNSLSLPPWLLALELLLCFVPMTWLFLVLVASIAYGAQPLLDGALFASATLVGPFGLLVGFRNGVFGRPLISRLTLPILCLMAAWNLINYVTMVVTESGLTEAWRETLLLAILPAAACLHLLRLRSVRPAAPATA